MVSPKNERFQVNRKTRRKLEREKARIERRLEAGRHASGDGPVFSASNIRYELADKASAIAHGGIGAIHLLVKKVGLAERIDESADLATNRDHAASDFLAHPHDGATLHRNYH